MRIMIALISLCLPTFGIAQDGFGDWVSQQLGYAPFYTQSIGWDMPEPLVRVTDPLADNDAIADFIATPKTTAWVVGVLQDENDARLAGMALVWSDGPFDRVVELGSPETRNGFVAFQTPQQTEPSDGTAQAIATQLADLSPGPVMAELSDGSVFPAGDSGISAGCFEISALYKSNDDLVALVVLFQSNARVDADAPACIPLTS